MSSGTKTYTWSPPGSSAGKGVCLTAHFIAVTGQKVDNISLQVERKVVVLISGGLVSVLLFQIVYEKQGKKLNLLS